MNIMVAYIPVIHEGYLKFFSKYNCSRLYILNEAILYEFPDVHLERDLRAISPESIEFMLEKSSGYFSEIKTAGVRDLKEINKPHNSIIMPNEDISLWVADKYLSNAEIIFDNVFLRWDKNRSVLEKTPDYDRAASNDGFIGEIMKKLDDTASRSPDWWRQVAAAVVRGRVIENNAYNMHHPTPFSLYALGDPRSNFDAGEHIEISTAEH